MNPVGEGKPSAGPQPELELRLQALEDAIQRLSEANAWWRLLEPHVPAGERVAVLADPAMLPPEMLGRPVVGVLAENSASPAGVARLEARHVEGVRFLLVPQAAWPHVLHDAHLAEHLRANYRLIAEYPEAGAVFEALTETARDNSSPPLGVLIDGLCAKHDFAPILDWTSEGLAFLLPDRNLIRLVEPDVAELPYLDDTIDIVLVDDPDHLSEAARVATNAAVLVATDGAGGAVVTKTLLLRKEDRPAPSPLLIVVATEEGDEWLEQLRAAMAARPGVEVRASAELVDTDAISEDTTVVLAERGVLPLPDCIETAEQLLAAEPQTGGVAVKLFATDGSLEAAGAAVFADGSVEAIARGATPSAPWHEYLRPVAAAVGLVVLRPAAALQCMGGYAAEFDLTRISARVWSDGWELRYQPDAAAVRVTAPEAVRTSIWPRAPHGLPTRPDEFDEASWRFLLARDEVGAVR